MEIKRENGKKHVTLNKNDYGIDLSVCRNGWQSMVTTVDTEILAMIREVINEYFTGENERENTD